MGTFGINIGQDDLSKDVIGDYRDTLKKTGSFNDATSYVISRYSDMLNDSDEGPLVYIALALVQWEYGVLDEHVLNKVTNDLRERRGIQRWLDEGLDICGERIRILEDFISKLQSDNPKPKRLPKLIVREPLFQKGDCLAIEFDDNKYAAYLVLDIDHSNIEYGQSLVILIDYCGESVPDLSVYKKAKFLKKEVRGGFLSPRLYKKQGRSDHKYYLYWLQRIGFRAIKKNVTVIGNINVKKYKKIKGMTVSRADTLVDTPLKLWGGDK